MADSIAVARLEEKVDRILAYIESQEAHNKECDAVRDKVLSMEASRGVVLWILGAFGTLTLVVSTAAGSLAAFLVLKKQ